jgi:hypothetical protein
MAIQLINGYHLTVTEKRAINVMINKGWTQAGNKNRTKYYTIMQGWQESGEWYYKVKIETRGTFTIGRGVETQNDFVTIKKSGK